MLLLVYVCAGLVGVRALDNGEALTPPMGWISWERFRCNVDCGLDPNNCISSQLFHEMAKLVKSEGYADAGYQYIIVDDCWLYEDPRSSTGELVPDPVRFPFEGIKDLAGYMHARGLQLGLEKDYMVSYCKGYPKAALLADFERDAKTYAEWNVDYLKVRAGCSAEPKYISKGYAELGHFLNKTGRPMVFGCSSPIFEQQVGFKTNFSALVQTCNLWRNYKDVEDDWSSVLEIINYFGDHQDEIASYAGPGHWNDPDQLLIGDFGLSYDQSKAQMALWAILAAPLLMSVDLRTIRPEYKAILQNHQIIYVDQDPLGIQGRRIYKENGLEIWTRSISPVIEINGQKFFSSAIVFFNTDNYHPPAKVTRKLEDMHLEAPDGYIVQDLYDGTDYGVLSSADNFTVRVNPSGVVMLKATVHQQIQKKGSRW